jgi:curved DNA-binding protein CbpA
VTQNRNPQSTQKKIPNQTRLADSYYALLGLQASASIADIKKAYHRLSKLYHPDTTELPEDIARVKFQRLNEAYATLSNLDRRSLYDLKIGYFKDDRLTPDLPPQQPREYKPPKISNSAYLDPIDRPLSAGEISVLFFLSATIVGCFILVIIIAYLRTGF